MRKTFMKNRSVLVSWMMSNMILIMLSLVLGSVIYIKAVDTIEKQANHVNGNTLNQIKYSMDIALKDVNRFSAYISLNKDVLDLIKKSTKTSINDDYYTISQILKNIRYFNIANEYADNFYIYFKNQRIILTKDGLQTPDNVYSSRLKYTSYWKMSHEEWKGLLNGIYTGNYLPLSHSSDAAASQGYIIYAKSLPISTVNFGEADATFLVFMNNKRLFEIIGNTSYSKNGYVMIIDEKDNILFSSGEGNPLLGMKCSEFKDDSGTMRKNFSKSDTIVTYISSSSKRWKYVLAIPSAILKEKVQDIRYFTGIFMILCIVAGVTGAYFLSKKNYVPVSELVHYLSTKYKMQGKNMRNEFLIIKDVMDTTFQENHEINERLKQQNYKLRADFLVGLLKGKYEDPVFIRKALSLHKVGLPYENFVIVLFYISSFNALFMEKTDQTNDYKLQLVYFIMTNIIEEMFAELGIGAVFEVDGFLACIVSTEELNPEITKKGILKVISEARDYIFNNFKIGFTAVYSDIHTTFFGLAEAYREALNALEYQRVTGIEEVIGYDMIKRPGANYEYSIETEHQIINFIKTGDNKLAKALLEQVFERNFSKCALTNDMVKCFIFDLVSTMLKTLVEININFDDPFIEKLNIMSRLINTSKLMDLKAQMMNILEEICDYIQTNKKSRKDQLLDSIVEFVEKNYHDPNLSVALIADHFHITATYLTKLYKDLTGEGLFDFITKVRIKEAKDLINNGSISVKELAISVGYYSCAAFIRTFRKYEGITPGQYRAFVQ